MNRQVRMLLTRLSTNLLSRSIRGVARTLAIVALLFVSQLIGGEDAFAQNVKPPKGMIIYGNGFGESVQFMNLDNYYYNISPKPGVIYPNASLPDGTMLYGAKAINEQMDKEKSESQDEMGEEEYAYKNNVKEAHSNTTLKIAKPKEDEETPDEIRSPNNQNTCPSCGNSGSKGREGFGGKKPFGEQGPLRRIVRRLLGRGRGGDGGGGCSGGSCSGGGFSGGSSGGCANGMCTVQ